ncbi:MAG: DNA topoisomerase VI, partial [Nanoarchaeota archaeon]
MAGEKSGKDIIKQMQDIAIKIYNTILKKENPSVNIPLRSLNNVKYDEKEGYFELIGKEKERTLTASTAK